MDIDLSKTRPDADIAAELVAANYAEAAVIHSGPMGALMSQPGGPERYGEIFHIMANLVEDPAKQIDYLLSAVYGFRNGSGLWDARKVRGLLDAAGGLLALVSEDARVELKRRRLYHLGLVQREVYEPRHFLNAAETHERAAAIAASGKKKIELVVAAVERLHHAIELGDRSLFKGFLRALGKKEKQLERVAAETRDAEAIKWLRADIPAHRFYACWLMGVEYEGNLTDLTSLDSLDEPLASQYAVWVEICKGMQSIDKTEYDLAMGLAEKVLARGGHPTHVCFGLMIAAVTSAQQIFSQIFNRPALARELARRIINYPAHGAHFVRAAARRRFLES